MIEHFFQTQVPQIFDTLWPLFYIGIAVLIWLWLKGGTVIEDIKELATTALWLGLFFLGLLWWTGKLPSEKTIWEWAIIPLALLVTFLVYYWWVILIVVLFVWAVRRLTPKQE